MNNGNKVILLIEDNPDDVMLTLRAFKRNQVLNKIIVAKDGIEAIDFLLKRGIHANRDPKLSPSLVILDLNLPKLNGLTVLKSIRENEQTRLLPVVILTSSKEEQDLFAGYSLGANSYVRKPVDFNEFVEAVKVLGVYWLVTNESPPARAMM